MMRARYAPGDYLARGAVTSRLVLAVVSALVAASTLVILTPNPDAAAAPDPVLGVYAGAAYPPAVPAFTTTLGAQPPFAMDFIDGTTWRTITQRRWPYSQWKGKGYTMIWGVDMLPDTYTPNTDPSDAGGSCYGLTQGATGEFDHYFRTVATNIVRAGLPDLCSSGSAGSSTAIGSPWAAQGITPRPPTSATSTTSSPRCGRCPGRTSPSSGTRPAGTWVSATWPSTTRATSMWTTSAWTSTTSNSRRTPGPKPSSGTCSRSGTG